MLKLNFTFANGSNKLVTIHNFSGIRVFAELTGNDFMGGVVLYSGKEVVPFGKNLWAVPFYILWQ